MVSNKIERSVPKKRHHFFGVSVLVLAICAMSWPFAVAEPQKPVQKSVKEEALPAPGTYKIDPAHSFAYFSAWHHLVGRVRGRFDKVTGTFTVLPDPAACSVDVTIDVSTISTQISERDKDLLGDAYFDVKKFLTMTYQGRGIHRFIRSVANGRLVDDARCYQGRAAHVQVQWDLLRYRAEQACKGGVPWNRRAEARRIRHGGARQLVRSRRLYGARCRY